MNISIPAISVKAKFVTLGLDKVGTLQVPTTGTVMSWFDGAPAPVEKGPAIVAGHVDWKGKIGVFYRLKDLKKGFQILISRADGCTVKFAVTQSSIAPKLNFPTERVYGDIKLKRHVDNVIVFAKMVK